MRRVDRAGRSVRLLAVVGLATLELGCGDDPSRNPSAPEEDSTVQRIALVDAGHRNFHTLSSTLAPLGELLRGEGWQVRSYEDSFQASGLEGAAVLVVSNALHGDDADDWTNPIRSAFTPEEVVAVQRWVEGGGGLLLIADHMPFPAAAASLARVFGVRFTNGFAFDSAALFLPSPCVRAQDIHVFRREDGTLGNHPVIRAQDGRPRVDSVGTFTGQAFTVEGPATPLMIFNATSVSLYPDTSWVFRDDTRRESVAGWLQGALLEVGEGRAAFFGEAAMFTEQQCGGSVPMGWNAPPAAQNADLALNVMEWLAGG